jgi:hypothetical protein
MEGLKQVFNQALRQLQRQSGIRTEIQNQVIRKSGQEDEDTNITISQRGIEHTFNVILKGEVREGQALGIVEKIGKKKDHWLLIARYITQPLKESFKSAGINYLEEAGNCFIHVPGIFIYITDQKVTPIRNTPGGKLWMTGGLKILLAIIDQPELLQATYREIAKAANIALGSVGPLLEELKEEGYMVHKDGSEVLTQKDKLIDRWAEIYHATLRPKLIIAKYRFLAEARFQQIEEGIYWGGEYAAAILTPRKINPEKYIIYTDRPGNELVKKLKIVPDDDGKITVLEKFWGDLPYKGRKHYLINMPNTVPALLIYADLFNDMDSRNREVAITIKKMYLNGE